MGRNFRKITQSPAYRPGANGTSVTENRQSLQQVYAGNQSLLPGLCLSHLFMHLQTASTGVGFLPRTSASAWDSSSPTTRQSPVLPVMPGSSLCSWTHPNVSSMWMSFWSTSRVMPISNSHSLSPYPIDSGHETHHYTEQLAASVLHTRQGLCPGHRCLSTQHMARHTVCAQDTGDFTATLRGEEQRLISRRALHFL